MPYGWEVADITDDVRDAVVRLHTFGTDFVVGESGKAFHTAKGQRPGALEMIWDYKSLACGVWVGPRVPHTNGPWSPPQCLFWSLFVSCVLFCIFV